MHVFISMVRAFSIQNSLNKDQQNIASSKAVKFYVGMTVVLISTVIAL